MGTQIKMVYAVRSIADPRTMVKATGGGVVWTNSPARALTRATLNAARDDAARITRFYGFPCEAAAFNTAETAKYPYGGLDWQGDPARRIEDWPLKDVIGKTCRF